VLFCVEGTRFARSTAQLSCPPPSLQTQLLESKPAAYIDKFGGATPPKVSKTLGRLLVCRCGGIEVYDSTVHADTIVQAGVQAGD
jgi:hypothetical protein